jgi:hypothetical protein
MHPIPVSIEVGQKRAFAEALAWPGWCRGGRDETGALTALLAYGPRYGAVLAAAGIEFAPPTDAASFHVTERVEGNATTEFGAPGVIAPSAYAPLTADEYARGRAILTACWASFDRAVAAAAGHELRKGPRGGGRDLDKMVAHVVEAEQAYLPRLAARFKRDPHEDAEAALLRTRTAVLQALDHAVTHGLPEQGPRGGVIWTPRYFINRAAWHVLDHVWEIEDRMIVP